MENKYVSKSCWTSNEKSTGRVEKAYICPECHGESQEVKSITVEHFVHDSLVDKVEKGNYHICLNKDCDVIYFKIEQELIFKKDSIRVPIGFKKDANPKYICYCNKVTEQQIIDAILNKDAKNMKDIIRITGAMKNGECETNNPLGKCCGPTIQKIINVTLNDKK